MKFERFINISTFIVFLVAIIFKIIFFIFKGDLWQDEVEISLQVVENGFTGLLKPTTAPIGFLLIQKLSYILYGISKYAFRLIPLIISILSLLLFYKIINKILDKRIAFYGFSIFCLSFNLLFYSIEAKQYIIDVFITLVLINRGLEKEKKYSEYFITGIILLLSFIFSHPAIFLISSILIDKFLYGNKKIWIKYILIILPLLICIGLNYLKLSENNTLKSYWNNAFLAFNYKSFHDAFYSLTKLTYNKISIIISFILFILGCIRIQKKIIFISPFIFCIILSIFHIYPFEGRLILFLVPLFIIINCFGFQLIFERFNSKLKKIILSLLLIHLLINFSSFSKISIFYLSQSIGDRRVVEYLSNNSENQDIIIISKNDFQILKFYSYLHNIKANVIFNLDRSLLDKYRNIWVINLGVDKKYDTESIKIDLIEKQLEPYIIGSFSNNISYVKKYKFKK